MGLQYGKVLCTLAFKAAAPKQNLGQRSGTISYNRIEDKSTTVTFHITNSLPQRQGEHSAAKTWYIFVIR